jgi:HK97 gp10 family phage protein
MAGILKTISSIKWYGEEQKKRILTGTEKGMVKCGLRIESEAKQLCRVDTGRLRASITTAWTGYGGDRARMTSPVPETQQNDPVSVPTDKDFTVQIGTNVNYASHIEHGTVKMEARPFLFPAYEMNIRKLKDFIKGEIPDKSVIPGGTNREGGF